MKRLLICGLCILMALTSFAQIDSNTTLYKTILTKDSLLFEVGFNQCDVQQFKNLLSDNLEFYHDINGLSDKAQFLQDIKKGLCKNPNAILTSRVIIKDSTAIFPLYNNKKLYGVIQNGTHLFYNINDSQPEIAQFTHLWLLENNEWKLNKALSFNHQAYPVHNKNTFLGNDKAVAQWLQTLKIPALGLGIIENGQLQQIRVYGTISNKHAAPYNTIFNVASLTKPVTAIVALRLVSLGKLDLDEPVYKYWTDPDVADDKRNKLLTTRLILSHQSGFPNWRWLDEHQKLSFYFTPGTQYQYSGEGMEYLRKALEHKFNKSLQQLAEELIFQPLKMNDTRYVWNNNIDTNRFALNYDKNGNTYPIVKNKFPNAADDLLTTIEDYGTFLVSVLNGDGLTKTVFDEMHKPQVASERGKHFGLGFEIYTLDNGEYALSHGGSDDGVKTIFFILPKTKKGLLIFTNSDTGIGVYETLIKKYLGLNGQKIFDIETQ